MSERLSGGLLILALWLLLIAVPCALIKRRQNRKDEEVLREYREMRRREWQRTHATR